MLHQVVISSHLSSVGYDPGEDLLEIRFQSGAVYQYRGVPNHLYAELMAAGSKGKYFHQFVKGKYPYQKVHPSTQGEV
ncbi:KTSC domain-containing protein [Streptomyces sp. TRM43335]|uniref:KTSC domain-containing protein n=2 Tax=Streptomyces taklimakanensis TaxID=2569853 RepID=A0A6G2BA16_9ACTN|nr:KTSC domain-containing protein [Streptomyces taklimakanensis]MTE18742.1 KTSC domain-containing protein [Streptomyces taklimakanensis]